MLGDPSGASGWVYGSQSGTESRMSMLMVPLNDLGMERLLFGFVHRHSAGSSGVDRLGCTRNSTEPESATMLTLPDFLQRVTGFDLRRHDYLLSGCSARQSFRCLHTGG